MVTSLLKENSFAPNRGHSDSAVHPAFGENLWRPALATLGLILLFAKLPHAVTADGLVRFEAILVLLEKHRLSDMAYSIIGPLFSIPLYLLGHDKFDAAWWCARYNTFVFAASLAGMYALLRNRVERTVLWNFVLLLIAASMFPHALRDYFGETFTVACVAIGILALCMDHSVIGSSLLVLGVANTPATLIGSAFFVGALVWDTRRLRYVAPLIGAVALILLESWLRRGSPFHTGYEGNSGYQTVLPYSGLPGFSYPFAFGVLSILLSFG
jgi:hypothetical protein